MSETTYTDYTDKADDEVVEYYDDAPEEPEEGSVSAFSVRARFLTLSSAVLMLILLTGAIAWLLGSQNARARTPSQTTGQAGDNATKEAAKVGFLAPDFTLTDANTSKPVHLASLRGKPVWINFWATWCHACVEEMPDMKKVYAQYKDKGLVILGVDDEESRTEINDFTRSNGYDWTFLLDPRGHVIDLYRVDGIPTHWFIDKDGVLKAVQVGSIPEGDIKNYLAKIVE